MHFLSVEHLGCDHNRSKVQLLNTKRIVSSFGSSCCGWIVLPTWCSKFELSSISVGTPCDYVLRLGGKFLFLILVGKFSSNSSSSSKSGIWKLESIENHFRSNTSKICVPPNSTSLMMSNMWGLPMSQNLLWYLLNMTRSQLICILVSVNATKIMSFFTT